MDFARKQLEKYGWTDGKGLGKHENGISQALKPKLKRSVTGVGHDAASEFNDHWWTALYDKALGNVEVKNKNGKTKKIKTKDDGEFIITNNTWKIKRKQKSKPQAEQYSEYFVRTAVLTSGGSKTEKVRDSESEEEDRQIRDVFKMTDEELFAVCEGRTAHKGARHGIKAIGKLARIAQQEAILLAQPKYNGYSHAKNLKDKIEIVEEMNLNDSSEDMEHKKKKKKKRCNSLNNKPSVSYIVDQSNEESVLEKNAMLVNDCVTSILQENEKSSKCKNNNQAIENVDMDLENDDAATNIVKSKKKKKRQADNDVNAEEKKPKKRKKKMNLD